MQRRDHAQRQHIIHSLDALLYQLHVLSFFMSPSIWSLFCRIISQVQCSKPRVFDPNRSLRVWFIIILFFNASSLWSHWTEGAAKGKAVILDFVGMAYVPSKMQLLFLDVLIVFLQMLLATISYETSLSYTSLSTDTPNPLQDPSSPHSSPVQPPSETTAYTPSKNPTSTSTTPYVIDLRLATIISRLRNPPPPTPDPSLPLPNTTPSPWRTGLGMLARAQMQGRRSRAGATTSVRTVAESDGGADGEIRHEDGSRNFPGSMNAEI